MDARKVRTAVWWLFSRKGFSNAGYQSQYESILGILCGVSEQCIYINQNWLKPRYLSRVDMADAR